MTDILKKKILGLRHNKKRSHKVEASTRMCTCQGHQSFQKAPGDRKKLGWALFVCFCCCFWSLTYQQPHMVEAGFTHSSGGWTRKTQGRYVMRASVLHPNMEEGK